MCTKVGTNSWKMGTLPDVFRAWTVCAGEDGAMFALRVVKEQACGRQDVILGYIGMIYIYVYIYILYIIIYVYIYMYIYICIYIYVECSKLQGTAPNPYRKLKSTAMQTYG